MYTNPVYNDYLADPFVIFADGLFYAYGTGAGSADGVQFPVVSSSNLTDWRPEGWALHQPPGDQFWAPEVVYRDGQYVMYYSAHGIGGNDHQLRAAVSDHPAGAFRDVGRVLGADQPFSIDPHPFQDVDGAWYLFYSRDFLTLDMPHRVGTGIVVDRLVDAFTLAGEPRLVVRPFADWQLFKAEREMYGGVYDWHTVEGAAVLRHNHRCYCFYSGGAWERENYGISYVTADHPLGPYRPPEVSEPILKTLPDKVIGPGHNSFIVTPDQQHVYCVYHAWDVSMRARLMHIDPLVWRGDNPLITGPSWTPQPLYGFDSP